MNFDREMESRVKETEAILKAYLPDESGWARTVMEAMNYSVNAGGKRLRPILMAETYRLFGGTDKIIGPFMADDMGRLRRCHGSPCGRRALKLCL